VLARGTRTLAEGGDARVTLTVTRRARKPLRRQRRLEVTLTTRTRIGAQVTPTRRALTLKR
jgi:hypothetical protein